MWRQREVWCAVCISERGPWQGLESQEEETLRLFSIRVCPYLRNYLPVYDLICVR